MLAIRRWSQPTYSCFTSGPVSTWVSDRSWVYNLSI